MTSTQGRRPDGPGWYWLTYNRRVPGQWEQYDGPVWHEDGQVWTVGLTDPVPYDTLPGTFTPLTKPVAAPEVDWSQAPEWAMWTTVDATGMRQWWGNEPPGHSTSQCVWMNGEYPGKYATGGRIDLPIGCDWRTTLHRRPEVGDE